MTGLLLLAVALLGAEKLGRGPDAKSEFDQAYRLNPQLKTHPE